MWANRSAQHGCAVPGLGSLASPGREGGGAVGNDSSGDRICVCNKSDAGSESAQKCLRRNPFKLLPCGGHTEPRKFSEGRASENDLLQNQHSHLHAKGTWLDEGQRSRT
ncbi:hypothetical protein N658DRAFT_486065 [Parathielavia hyrcaniae]|uniref:Uncharacterized protein n=1 Tax=Parathielavia hyrcaniae TaxID=113614 RepID=A0AAN6Q0Q3_9PEZI|nr:hypothetical protein N658DRAFT_486065 [Parathielavia hyrcaniae]